MSPNATRIRQQRSGKHGSVPYHRASSCLFLIDSSYWVTLEGFPWPTAQTPQPPTPLYHNNDIKSRKEAQIHDQWPQYTNLGSF